VKINPQTKRAWTAMGGAVSELSADGNQNDTFLFNTDYNTVFDFMDGNKMVVADLELNGFYLYDIAADFLSGPFAETEQSTMDIVVGPDQNIYVANATTVVRYSSTFNEPTVVLNNINIADIVFAKAVCPPCGSGTKCMYGVCEPFEEKSKDKSSSTTLITAVVASVGGAVLLAAIVASILFVRRKKAAKEPEVLEMKQEPKTPDLDSHWEIQFKELNIGTEIGQGAFGTVYKALYRNSDCVVKQLKPGGSAESTSVFLKEAQAVKRIRPHKNVCSIFGVCTNPKHPICIVMCAPTLSTPSAS